jgi:hypothetical protein
MMAFVTLIRPRVMTRIGRKLVTVYTMGVDSRAERSGC